MNSIDYISRPCLEQNSFNPHSARTKTSLVSLHLTAEETAGKRCHVSSPKVTQQVTEPRFTVKHGHGCGEMGPWSRYNHSRVQRASP